jgi:adenine deaminase
MDPFLAIQMATLNAAEYFRLDDLGAIAPGYKADILAFEDLGEFKVKKVFKDGVLVAQDGEMIVRTPRLLPALKNQAKGSVRIKPMTEKTFLLRANQALAKVIQLVPNQIVTRKVMKKVLLRDGIAYPNIEEDVLKIVVVERHRGTGNVGIGFVQGFGLKNGAIGSSVAHDSHNFVIVGMNDQDIFKAVMTMKKMGGGLVAISDGKVLASLPLPIAGLMTHEPVSQVHLRMQHLLRAAASLGCKIPDPFMTLSFLSLPVIPELKLTDKGLVDVTQFKIVPVFGDANQYAESSKQ